MLKPELCNRVPEVSRLAPARRATERLQLWQNGFTKVKTSGGRPRISDRASIVKKTTGRKRTLRSVPGRPQGHHSFAHSPLRLSRRRSGLKSSPVFLGLIPSAKVRSIADRLAIRGGRGRNLDAKKMREFFPRPTLGASQS